MGLRRRDRRLRRRVLAAGERLLRALRNLPARLAHACRPRGEPTFALVRIIGNDLPPRHVRGQSLENVRFILEHEAPLPGCTKHWILNRIADPEAEAEIAALLDKHGQHYVRLPLELEEYARVDWELECRGMDFAARLGEPSGDFESDLQRENRVRYAKNCYAIHNNGARNQALALGAACAEWVLPWDGNCFVQPDAWQAIRAAVRARPWYRYVVVPMLRVTSNLEVLEAADVRQATEEPQIIFRRDARARFDAARPYGFRPKVDLLLRLGVPGVWRFWRPEPWDPPARRCWRDWGRFQFAGWVARLGSGEPAQESGPGASLQRASARSRAILALLDSMDRRVLRARWDTGRLAVYDEAALAELAACTPDTPAAALREQLLCDAEAAIAAGLYSVRDKSGMAPSGDPHDYWSVAPHWWPAPDTADGLPYVHRDGQRAPGTGFDDPERVRFDATALAEMIRATVCCALAWAVAGHERHARHGARLLSRWFLEAPTRMNPHLTYAQVRLGHNDDHGLGQGIIELRGVAQLLDAARLLERAGALGGAELDAFRTWLRNYFDWLLRSPQGAHARTARNNLGTFYDLQALALALYLGDLYETARALRRARARIGVQFAAGGAQPHELARTRPLHYSAYNLSAWTLLADSARRAGDPLWHFETRAGRSLRAGFEWLFRARARDSRGAAEPADAATLALLAAARERVFGQRTSGWPAPLAADGASPQNAVPPYWALTDASYLQLPKLAAQCERLPPDPGR